MEMRLLPFFRMCDDSVSSCLQEETELVLWNAIIFARTQEAVSHSGKTWPGGETDLNLTPENHWSR